MRISVRNILSKMNAPDFQNNFWTLMASGIVSAFNFIIKIIVVRAFGLADAGIFSFAVAVSGLSTVLFLYGVRSFQSTDIKQEFSLNSYVALRVITALFTMISVIVFIFVSRLELHRIIVVLLVCLIYWADAFADVFMGDLQQKGNMRIAGRMRVCAFTSSGVIFSITSFISRSLIVSLMISGVVVFVVYAGWIWVYRKQFRQVRVRPDISALKKLAASTTPIIIGGIVGTFLTMAQTYYLSFMHTDESVAVFTILMMPLTSLTILSHAFFLGAEMTKTAMIYATGQIERTSKRINGQLLLAIAVFIVFFVFVYFFGIPILSWLYNVDLSLYSNDFILLAVGGSFLLLFPVLGAAINVFRKQRAWMVTSIGMAFIVAPVNWMLVQRFEIRGAVYATLNIHLFLTVTAYILYRVSLRKRLTKLN